MRASPSCDPFYLNPLLLRLKREQPQKYTRKRVSRTQITTTRHPTNYNERKRTPRIYITEKPLLQTPKITRVLFCIKRWKLLPIFYRLDMCRRQYANDACNRGTAGNYRPSSRQQFPSTVFLSSLDFSSCYCSVHRNPNYTHTNTSTSPQ